MDLSLDSKFFINQIKTSQDKEIFTKYYDNFQLHLIQVKQYINIKKDLSKYIKLLLDQSLELSQSDFIIYNQLYNEINNSILLIEDDAIRFKNNFKKHLFYLIKK